MGGDSNLKGVGKSYSVARTLKRGCPRLMKMVELAQDQHFVNQKRKAPY